jgi:hypothetical protein
MATALDQELATALTAIAALTAEEEQDVSIYGNVGAETHEAEESTKAEVAPEEQETVTPVGSPVGSRDLV